MRFGWHAQAASRRLLRFMIFAAVGLVAVYAVIYFLEPFSTFANNLLVNVLTITAAVFSATCATLTWAIYEKTDAPRRIWGFFAFGLWLWVMGEITWGYQNLTLPNGEVPIGISDAFWVIAYYFLGQALLSQYQLLVLPTKSELTSRVIRVLLFLGVTFVLIFAILMWLDISASVVDTLVNAFYPAGDITLALAAIWLTRNFQGGALGRPWIGLLVFTFTDLMYAWLQLSGAYAWSLDQGNLVSGFSDIVYFSAYLVLGIGSFSQWLFLKYGLRSHSKAR
jgi:hypothetical protein